MTDLVVNENDDPVIAGAKAVLAEDSVPSDLTVSVSISKDQEISELGADEISHLEGVAANKRLLSEFQYKKLQLARAQADLEKERAELRQEIELLKRHVHLSAKENEALQKENHVATDQIVELQTSHLRLKAENVLLEETVSKLKKETEDWTKKWKDLDNQFQQVVRRIDRREFTFEQFERLRTDHDLLKEQCKSLTKENNQNRKSADKWRNKFSNLKNQYESRLQDEIAKMRNSLQSHIDMLRSSSTDHLESRLLESEQRRTKAVQEATHWRNVSEELKTKLREMEFRNDKTRAQLEQTEAAKNDLVQRLANASSSRSRMERELEETKRDLQAVADSLRQNLLKQERLSHQLQSRNESQAKRLQEYEEAFLGIHGESDETRGWPTLLKVQSQHSSRMAKRVTELETEKQLLLTQQQSLVATVQTLEAELESRDRMVNQIEGKAPETIQLFRDKDTLLRELRTQLNRKDLLLVDYARQVERLKRTRNQLAADLESILRDRTELEAVRRLLSPN